MHFSALRRLVRHEAANGVVLMLASASAVVLANPPWAGLYDVLLDVKGSVRPGDFGIEKPCCCGSMTG
jgi:Na+/H+ antiporter NhaA